MVLKVAIQDSKPGPTRAEISRVESELDVKFGQEYLDFISKYNGGRPDQNIFPIPPDNCSDMADILPFDDLPYEHGLFADRTGPSIIPIMNDAFGNSICISTSGDGEGGIYFLDHEVPDSEALTWLAPSLNAFLDGVEPD